MSAGVIAVLPVKRFGAAKQRTADVLGDEERRVLAQAMLSDVLASLAQCRTLAGTLVVTGEPAATRLAERFGADVVDDPDDAGHSAAAMRGQAEAERRGAAAALLLAGDCPLLAPEEIEALARSVVPGSVAVVPDRHGTGTNALLVAPPAGYEPSFGPGSRERHLRLAAERGLTGSVTEVPSLAIDLDTADDLRTLAAAVMAEPARCPATAATLRELGVAIL